MHNKILSAIKETVYIDINSYNKSKMENTKYCMWNGITVRNQSLLKMHANSPRVVGVADLDATVQPHEDGRYGEHEAHRAWPEGLRRLQLQLVCGDTSASDQRSQVTRGRILTSLVRERVTHATGHAWRPRRETWNFIRWLYNWKIR